MTVEALSSNVVNYLVWRYLQEAGYGNAALQLSRSWIRDPESLPFAKNVSHHALINILQDGLWFDKLQSEVSQSPQRYRFGRDHGRPYTIRDGADLTLEDPGKTQEEIRRDIQEANGNVAEITAPKRGGPRRRKKVNGVVEQRQEPLPNGDLMDLDQHGTLQATHSVRGESEAVVSEAESPTVAEIPISTLTIGTSAEIQTEKIVDLAPDSALLSIKDKTVTHTVWGQNGFPTILLTAGKSFVQLRHIPQDTLASVDPETLDIHLPFNNYDVTAICWDSNNGILVAAREEQVSDEGETTRVDKLVKINEEAQDVRIISSMLGMINTLRWNESSKMLLSISTSDVSGTIRVWKDLDVSPALTASTDHVLFDAAWVNDTSFVVCGDDFLQIYEIEGEELKPQRSFNDQGSWESVKYDAPSGIIACASREENLIGLGLVLPSDPDNLQKHSYPDPFFADFAFQPQLQSASKSSHLLATCSSEGPVRIWDVEKSFECIRRLTVEEDSTVHRVAFSPDGASLAAAGPDVLTIWNLEDGEFPMAPAAVWKAKDCSFGWDPSSEEEMSLNWNSDGKRIALGVGNQIAVINVPR